MNDFRELKVWQKARLIVKDVYSLTSEFPIEEKYALTSQIKRATVSISSNIAEGCGRSTNTDFAKFLDMALGSCYEIESDLIIATDLNFILENALNVIVFKIQEIEKMLVGLINSVRSKI